MTQALLRKSLAFPMFFSFSLILFSLIDLSRCERPMWSWGLGRGHCSPFLGWEWPLILCLQLPLEVMVRAPGFCTLQLLCPDSRPLLVHQPFHHLHIPSVGPMEPQNPDFSKQHGATRGRQEADLSATFLRQGSPHTACMLSIQTAVIILAASPGDGQRRLTFLYLPTPV